MVKLKITLVIEVNTLASGVYIIELEETIILKQQ